MYVPHFHAVEDEQQLRAMVAGVGSAQLVTVGPDGYPLATLLPVIWEGDTVIAHMARANPHWTQIADGSPVLLVVAGPQAYISPSWYASKAEHGRVVPTWNYSTVQIAGRARTHQGADWLRAAVDDLVERHEGHREVPVEHLGRAGEIHRRTTSCHRRHRDHRRARRGQGQAQSEPLSC